MPIKIEELTTRKMLRTEQIFAVLKNNSELAYKGEELAEILNCSTTTINRNILYLIQQKKVKKAYAKGKTAKIAYYYLNNGKEINIQ